MRDSTVLGVRLPFRLPPRPRFPLVVTRVDRKKVLFTVRSSLRTRHWNGTRGCHDSRTIEGVRRRFPLPELGSSGPILQGSVVEGWTWSRPRAIGSSLVSRGRDFPTEEVRG